MKTVLRESCSHYERYSATPSSTAKALYYYVQWTGHFVCNPDFLIRRQGYKSMLLLQTVSGCGTLQYQNQVYTLEPGTVALIDCMQLHTYFPKKDPLWEFRFLHFTGGRSFELYQHLLSMSGTPVLHANAQVETQLRRCMEYCSADPVYHEVKISKAISDILYSLLLELQHTETGQMNQVCDYIKTHYAQNLTTEVLANTFRFSRSYFSMQFKKHTGTTLHDYLLVCRLDQAKQLLSQSGMSISRIGEAVGFTDTGTFIRAFQRKEKCTPLQYRKHCGRV